MDVRSAILRHRLMAQQSWSEGDFSRAFAQLVMAAREAPLTARLASELVRMALKVDAIGPASALLSDASTDADWTERVGIRRALARLYRKSNRLEAAREQLATLLAEQPTHRIARRVLNALLEAEQRWEELDASLEKEARERVRAGKPLAAAKVTHHRARVLAQGLQDAARAALRLSQAAQWAASGNDFEHAFVLRMEWLKMLHQSKAPPRQLEEAFEMALDVGETVGRLTRVEALGRQLGLLPTKTTDDENTALEVDPRIAPDATTGEAQASDDDLELSSAQWEDDDAEPVAPVPKKKAARSSRRKPRGPRPPFDASATREELFEAVRKNPLGSDGYHLLAEYFSSANEGTRAALMREIAEALDGDEPREPAVPRLLLSANDRVGLKHSTLRGEVGELLGLSGMALARLYPARPMVRLAFVPESGKGGAAVTEALLTAIRILGLPCPTVYASEHAGPPFALIHSHEPELLVGRLAIRKELSEGELRFFAGRALFTQNPDLLVLRLLRKEQLQNALKVLKQVLKRGSTNVETRVVKEALGASGLDRVRKLFRDQESELDFAVLQLAARHSANRAGLVTCGAVGPALTALKAKKALNSELLELIRFASSERYVALRNRKGG
jgi:hypothetical protein